MTPASLDTEGIKARVDLPDLAGRYTILAKWSTKELAGPCPRGTCTAKSDGFHVHADGWFCCYTCHPKHGDAIEFLQWLGVVADFKAACEYLGGAQFPAPTQRVTPTAKPKQAGWQDATWQIDARAILARAQFTLDASGSEPGRAYLTGRGILPETWQAWGLGFDPAKFDPATGRKRPAVVIPWQRDRITAVKYRFTDSASKGDRFTQKGGGQQIAFGLNLAGTHQATLWLCEGELNALSIWQALRASKHVGFDLVSFGGDSQASHLDPVISAWAGKYRQVIVWADDPAKTEAALRAIPGAFGLRSPEVDGRKLDANELLKLGGLADFVRAAWRRFDQDPDYTARLQAEIEAAPDLASESV